MNVQVWDRFAGKQVVLLQGPVGPFFANVARALRATGAASVHKINFNGGDWWFYRRGSVNFRGTAQQWPLFLDAYLARHAIETIVLFGDCRPIHRAAHAVAAARGVAVWVFEEGYIRPNYITLEQHGVNGFSAVPTEARFYEGLPVTPPAAEQELGSTFGRAARCAIVYYLASLIANPWFNHRLHHRPIRLIEGWPWVRSYWRKLYYRVKERAALALLTEKHSKQYFLVPLQVARDSQIHTHSRFESVADFIREVTTSFATHAPADTMLAIKHHPMDRGHHDYADLLHTLATQHNIVQRVVYLHDQHLPTLLAHARGVVVINSTVGLSALHHETPVITLGKAIYDIAGLTYQGGLSDFWREAPSHRPSLSLYWKLRNYLVEHTQINTSFYGPWASGADAPLGEPASSVEPTESCAS